MKKLAQIIFIILIGFVFSGCENPEKENPPDQPIKGTVEVSSNNFAFDADGGSHNLTITSNTTWTINFNSSDWCTPSIQTSKGNATLALSAQPNDSEEPRNHVLTVSALNTDTIISISCTQEGKKRDTIPQEPVLEDYIEPDHSEISTMPASNFAAQMGLGWNLGNTLEAIIVNGDALGGNETSWGNPAVTKSFIDAVKAAGFNTIRIPVSWSHQLEDESTFKIKYAWKQRVEEVVNYALDNDMYVMINIHWDGGWLDHPDYEHQESINTKLEAYWKQIAKFFRDYNDHLLFAGTNEVHVEGYYGNPTAENVAVQNSFNQTFVETVRATGGRNTYRYLVVQGYNTNIDHTVNHFVLPEDDEDNRLMVEVHYYDPYDFTLMEEGDVKTQWGRNFAGGDVSSWGQEDWVDEVFAKMKTNFSDKGIPVILGEYAATLRLSLNGVALENHLAARNDYFEYVTTKAVENGMVPVYWDNGHTGNNGSGLFDRSSGEVIHTDALNAILKGLDNN